LRRARREIAQPKYFDATVISCRTMLPERIAEAVYDIHIKAGILFAPHPAFAKDEQGNYPTITWRAKTLPASGPRLISRNPARAS